MTQPQGKSYALSARDGGMRISPAYAEKQNDAENDSKERATPITIKCGQTSAMSMTVK
jgi:hypothetical protein